MKSLILGAHTYAELDDGTEVFENDDYLIKIYQKNIKQKNIKEIANYGTFTNCAVRSHVVKHLISGIYSSYVLEDGTEIFDNHRIVVSIPLMNVVIKNKIVKNLEFY